MSDHHGEAAKRAFQQALLAVSQLAPNADSSDLARIAVRFHEAFLQFGSAGEDNINCLNQIEVGSLANGGGAKAGLRLAGRDDVSLTDLLWTAEGCAIPAEVRHAYPDLSQAQWDAALRMATVLCLAFEGESVQ